MGITNQSQTLIERLLKKNKEKITDQAQNSNIEKMVKKYGELGQEIESNKILEK